MECAEGSDQESAEGQKKGEAGGEVKMNAEVDQRAAEDDKIVDVEEPAENYPVIDMNAEGDECATGGDKTVDVAEEIFENLVVTDMNEEAASSGFSLQETANEEPEADAITISRAELGSSEDVLNATLVEKMATGPGSDSGVEVNGGASPAGFLRAFSGSYGTSSCGDTPATASCDSSLISCCSAYEDTEEVATTTATTMLLPSVEREGDGTSEGGSESSSVDTDIRNKGGGSRRISSQGVNLGSTNSRTAAKKKSISDTPTKAKVTSRGSSSTPVTSSSATRPKTTVSRPSRTPPSPGVSTQPKALSTTVSTSSSHQDKSMVSSCGSIRSARSSTKSTSSSISSGSTLRPVLASASKARTKDSSMSSTSSRDSTASPAAGRGRASTSRSSAGSLKTKPIGATDDGRWPSSANRVHHRPQASNKMEKKQMMSSLLSMNLNGSLMESKATALEKYATLPRRRRHKSPETTPVVPSVPVLHRSHSVSRDPSLNRAASLRKQHHHQTFSNKSLPPYPRRKRTIIYHEMAIQTALTGDDMAKALAGIAIVEPLKCVDTQEQGVQVDQTAEEVDHLELQLKLLNEDHAKLKEHALQQSEEMSATEQQLQEERAAKAKVTEELERHSQCIQNILSTANGDHVDESGIDCLQALENYFRSSSHVVLKQQQEIGELQMLCRTLQRDLEKSLAAQKTLLQQQQDIEVESMELQDFLQAEKSTLAEALKDAETEIKGQKELLSQKEHELEQQQEECKHLVRISEQRRQENLALQAKLNSLEQRSRELLLQQGAAVSGAAVALSGLSSRLDGLVEQLVISYNISEKDLEDVIFHNEAYSKSNSSVEASPEKMSSSRNSDSMLQDTQRTPSPKRGASFVSAVISAIRNAAAGGTVKPSKMSKEDEEGCGKDISSGAEIAEVVEPVNNTEQPDEAESNDRHSTGSTSTRCLANSESLQNLSQAILNRQQFEMAQTESTCSEDIVGIECESADLEALPPLEDYSPAITLVDQIIDVDNLVTKLLKVLRIIQLENDTCIDELHDERMQLAEQVRREQENRREAQDELRNWERIGARLRGEAQDVRLQLHRRVQELEEKKEELRQHKEKIEQLTQELCNLSSMCKQLEEQLRSREDEAEHILQQWQESGQYPSPESLARVITVQNEVPDLKEKLSEKERQLSEMGQKYALSKQVLTQNWHQAATEVRRQYEAIDTALETLHDIQGVVLQCPPLAKLQQDLEETNFQCASSLPLIAADLNANAPQLLNITHNGSHNSSTSRIDAAHNSGNAINGTA